MTKLRHPGRTPAQRRVLDEIGSGNFSPRMTNRMRDDLIAEGLIVLTGEKPIGRDALGKISIPEFEMPIHVHYAWCKVVGSADYDDADGVAA